MLSTTLLLLLFVSAICQISGHPLCTNGASPEPDYINSFCTMYNDRDGCCNPGENNNIFSLHESVSSTIEPSSSCNEHMRNILCARCDAWAAHIVGEDGILYHPNKIPMLCPDYAESFYNDCADVILGSEYPFGTTHIANSYTYQAFVDTFTNNDGYCYNGMPYDPVTAPEFHGKEDGLCVSEVVRPGNEYYTAAFMPDGRMLYASRTGIIKIYDSNTIPFVPLGVYLTIPGVDFSSEGGVLGIAIHPQWPYVNRFFVSYTPTSTSLIVSEFKALGDPSMSNVAVATEEQRIVEFTQSGTNHNGGQLLFGPDGYLYMFFGDGGGNGHLASQNLLSGDWSGKIHRIDIDNGTPFSIPSTNPFFENFTYHQTIYAWGFRNPWRNSFDRVTGDLYSGDVGQDSMEEINLVRMGHNYGWRKYEGTRVFSPGDQFPKPSEVTFPVLQYTHSETGGHGAAIIGGYVYRGYLSPCHYGKYVYADQANGVYVAVKHNATSGWSKNRVGLGCSNSSPLTCALKNTINSLVEDNVGNVYFLTGNSLLKIVNQDECIDSYFTCIGGNNDETTTMQIVEVSTEHVDQTTETEEIESTTNEAVFGTTSPCEKIDSVSWTGTPAECRITITSSRGNQRETRAIMLGSDFVEVFDEMKYETYESPDMFVSTLKARVVKVYEFIDNGEPGFYPTDFENYHEWSMASFSDAWEPFSDGEWSEEATSIEFNSTMESGATSVKVKVYPAESTDTCFDEYSVPMVADFTIDLDWRSRISFENHTQPKIAIQIRYTKSIKRGDVTEEIPPSFSFQDVLKELNVPTPIHVSQGSKSVPVIYRMEDKSTIGQAQFWVYYTFPSEYVTEGALEGFFIARKQRVIEFDETTNMIEMTTDDNNGPSSTNEDSTGSLTGTADITSGAYISSGIHESTSEVIFTTGGPVTTGKDIAATTFSNTPPSVSSGTKNTNIFRIIIQMLSQ